MTTARPLIAVVDDDTSVRRALCRLLSSAKFSVEPFGSGQAFLDSLSGRHPDCMLLDLDMPDLSGFDIQHSLRESSISIPVIVVTASDEPEARSRSLANGAIAFISKPVDSSKLLAAIAQVVNPPPPLQEPPRGY